MPISAIKIKMKPGCYTSQSVLEIDEIYLSGVKFPGFYKKADIYDFLVENPNTIIVGIPPYPKLIPELSSRNEKYVRSTPNNYSHDNLLMLPRE